MKKKLIVLGLVMALLVSLAGCAASTPSTGDTSSIPLDQPTSSSEGPSEESVPEYSESDPQSSEPEVETSKEKPTSIFLYQERPGYKGFLWELRIEDEEELALVEELLSTQLLSPSSEEYASWPDGGNSILFEIYYENRTVTGACNPQHNGGIFDRGYTSIKTDEDGIFYDYPREVGDQLLEFLESKGITVD